MKTKKQVIYLVAICCVIISGFFLLRLYKPSVDNVQPKNVIAEDRNANLPIGYTMKNYTVEKDLGVACKKDEECETPPEYMMISRCPMQTICLYNTCTVICPSHK